MRFPKVILPFSLCLAVAFAACGKRETAGSAPEKAAVKVDLPTPPGEPGKMAAPGPKMAERGEVPDAITGKVAEKINAERYSYLRLATGKGDVWAAVPTAAVEVGQQVTVVGPMPMDGFESKTLKRKFDQLYFGTLDSGDHAGHAHGPGEAHDHGPAAAAPAAQTPPGTPRVEAAGDFKVPKADGPSAFTIAEVFAQKDALKDKEVVVRGKVVKFTAGVMGKNWIHLQDGSGAADKGTHDLTFTTSAATNIGAVVILKGALHLDKDFGAGYAYPVIVEDAALLP